MWFSERQEEVLREAEFGLNELQTKKGKPSYNYFWLPQSIQLSDFQGQVNTKCSCQYKTYSGKGHNIDHFH